MWDCTQADRDLTETPAAELLTKPVSADDAVQIALLGIREHGGQSMSDDDKNHTGDMGRRANWVLIGFVVIAGYFLVLEHKAHLVEGLRFLPYLLLLACLLMHLFMHGGHGGPGNHRGHDRPQGKPADDAGKGDAK